MQHSVSPLAGIGQFPIIPALCCYLIVLVAIAGDDLTFNMARRGRDARSELHVQAW
ncbi:MAG: hypothetical protein ACKV2T_08390 [Kofleriaceae bacterium]